jgi:hypothetical protein
MNPEKQEVKRPSELIALRNELEEINGQSAKCIIEIMEKIQAIYYYAEPKDGSIKSMEQQTDPPTVSLLTSMREQLKFGRDNLDNLSIILRHLNVII